MTGYYIASYICQFGILENPWHIFTLEMSKVSKYNNDYEHSFIFSSRNNYSIAFPSITAIIAIFAFFNGNEIAE